MGGGLGLSLLRKSNLLPMSQGQIKSTASSDDALIDSGDCG